MGCIEGMEWIEAYMEDPIFQAEAALFLEQHWCSPERPQCIPAIQHHFIPMHVMVMERFMVPTDICNNQFAACNPDWTTHPHPTEGPHPTHPPPTHYSSCDTYTVQPLHTNPLPPSTTTNPSLPPP